MPLHCRRFVDFLLLDHCGHAGRENGHLQATYDQLVAWGISRKYIAGAIREAVDRGLVEVTMTGGLFGLTNRRTPSRYRLTWIGTLRPSGKATNEWRRFKKKTVSREPTVGTVHPSNQQREVA